MFAFKVSATPQDMVRRFADALPAKWSSYLEILKENGVLDTITIYELIQKLENKDVEEKLKAKEQPLLRIPRCILGLQVVLLEKSQLLSMLSFKQRSSPTPDLQQQINLILQHTQ
ncbi:hypothetical protein HanPSC8_Chr13g0594471 [Helianthus annuus]|nr:hypothetical protein HanPSC8_Chr13g0594471 [Helianthus annuus]